MPDSKNLLLHYAAVLNRVNAISPTIPQPLDLQVFLQFILDALKDPLPPLPSLRREEVTFKTAFQDTLGHALLPPDPFSSGMPGDLNFALDDLVADAAPFLQEVHFI